MKHNDLDIWRMPPIKWRPIISAVLVYSLCLGGAFYRWMTYSTPITADAALQIFESERELQDGSEPTRSDGSKKSKNSRKPGTRTTAVVLASTHTNNTEKASSSGPTSKMTKGRGVPTSVYAMPAEGVYSWTTQGWESASGAKRQMPEVSHNIVTHDGAGGWTTHHYFSEEKEYWTSFRLQGPTVEVTEQRNRVIFGPVTNDSTVTFRPPMLVGPADLELGQTWRGSWKGSTSGTFTGETFEQTTLDIDGTPVDVWAIRIRMNITGEFTGTVVSEVWFAPQHGLAVKEHWTQNVKASVGDYQSEWTVTLRSLTPRTS